MHILRLAAFWPVYRYKNVSLAYARHESNPDEHVLVNATMVHDKSRNCDEQTLFFVVRQSPRLYKFFLKCVCLLLIQCSTAVFMSWNYDHAPQLKFYFIEMHFRTVTHFYCSIIPASICAYFKHAYSSDVYGLLACKYDAQGGVRELYAKFHPEQCMESRRA